jgi:hypothetical protein
MSDYLENLATRALGKSDFLQPRMPSRFEPVLSKGPLSSSFSHVGILEEPEEMMGQEYAQGHKQSPSHNPDRESVKLPASNPIETENPQGFKFEVQGRRDAIHSIDLPLKSEEHAAPAPQEEKNQFAKEKPGKLERGELYLREEGGQKHKLAIESMLSHSPESIEEQTAEVILKDELRPLAFSQVEVKGILPDIRQKAQLNVKSNATNSSSWQKIPPSNRSTIERGLTERRTDDEGIFQKALSIKKGRNGNSVFQSSPGRERAEILATRIIDSDSKEIAAQLLQSAAPGERSIAGPGLLHDASASSRAARIDHAKTSAISSNNPIFGLKRESAIAKSSKNFKNLTEASQELSEQMTPSIKVTIGRIDVRAVTHPEKRETRTETKTPPSSLGDYLISLRGKSR